MEAGVATAAACGPVEVAVVACDIEYGKGGVSRIASSSCEEEKV